MITERILQLLKLKSITKYKFCKDLGLSNGFLDKPREISTDKYANILAYFPDVNPEWLLTGSGSTLKVQYLTDTEFAKFDKDMKSGAYKPVSITAKEGIPLIPIEALAGFQGSDNDGITILQCEHYIVPEFEQKGVEFLTRVSGSSMQPKYNNGDILACKKIRELTFIQWGKIYVLDTVQGALVKRLYEDPKSSDRVICKSDNFERYKDFSIPISEIRSISIVLGVIRLE